MSTQSSSAVSTPTHLPLTPTGIRLWMDTIKVKDEKLREGQHLSGGMISADMNSKVTSSETMS